VRYRVVSLHAIALTWMAITSAMPNAQTAQSAQAVTAGAITGRVKLTARVRTPLAANAYPARTVEKHKAPAIPEIRNVVVYLSNPGFRGALRTTKSELTQENETFVPHVLAITRGSTVEFPNGDPFFHNVFSLSSTASFNLGRYPRGQTRAQMFNKPGLVKVFCDIHSHMSASILVLDHPYFTIPAVDGAYELTNVPAGQYTLIGWHERVGERSVTVRVEAGRTAMVDLTVPVEDLP
jgi:plastocyanin